VRVQLGNLYFNTGRLDEAAYWYTFTLARNPGYGPAQAGLAYVAAARGDDARAIELMTKAAEASPLPEYLIALGDLYARTGRTADAARQYDLVRALQKLFEANGTDIDVELALFEADHGTDLARALARARQGYERRPSIHAADALAWTLYRAGKPEEAERYAQEALRLGTKDALKLYHAGMIARALGKTDEARAYLQQALDLNPHFSLLHVSEARETLAALGGTVPRNTARNPE
jgi:tetratricopeptide (TPR) repeat protein